VPVSCLLFQTERNAYNPLLCSRVSCQGAQISGCPLDFFTFFLYNQTLQGYLYLHCQKPLYHYCNPMLHRSMMIQKKRSDVFHEKNISAEEAAP